MIGLWLHCYQTMTTMFCDSDDDEDDDLDSGQSLHYYQMMTTSILMMTMKMMIIMTMVNYNRLFLYWSWSVHCCIIQIQMMILWWLWSSPAIGAWLHYDRPTTSPLMRIIQYFDDDVRLTIITILKCVTFLEANYFNCFIRKSKRGVEHWKSDQIQQ